MYLSTNIYALSIRGLQEKQITERKNQNHIEIQKRVIEIVSKRYIGRYLIWNIPLYNAWLE